MLKRFKYYRIDQLYRRGHYRREKGMLQVSKGEYGEESMASFPTPSSPWRPGPPVATLDIYYILKFQLRVGLGKSSTKRRD